MGIYKAYKNLGETPLECLNRIVKENNIPEDEKVTFAGRLDPAATGEMIFLSGEDVYKKDQYTKADKIYEVEYILGISTDTGDLLGKVLNTDFSHKSDLGLKQDKLENAKDKLIGTREQDFHKFSSKIIEGIPMWQHGKAGNNVNASHVITIYSIDVLNISSIKISEVIDRVNKITNIVTGEFRQEEIIKSWNSLKEAQDRKSVV